MKTETITNKKIWQQQQQQLAMLRRKQQCCDNDNGYNATTTATAARRRKRRTIVFSSTFLHSPTNYKNNNVLLLLLFSFLIWNHHFVCSNAVTLCQRMNSTTYGTKYKVSMWQGWLRVYLSQSAKYGSCSSTNCRQLCNHQMCTDDYTIVSDQYCMCYNQNRKNETVVPKCSSTSKRNAFCNVTIDQCQCHFGYTSSLASNPAATTPMNNNSSDCSLLNLLYLDPNTKILNTSFYTDWVLQNLFNPIVYTKYILLPNNTAPPSRYYNIRMRNRAVDMFLNFFIGKSYVKRNFFTNFIQYYNITIDDDGVRRRQLMTTPTTRQWYPKQLIPSINQQEQQQPPPQYRYRSSINQQQQQDRSGIQKSMISFPHDEEQLKREHSNQLIIGEKQNQRRSIVFTDECLDIAMILTIESIELLFTSPLAFQIPPSIAKDIIEDLIIYSNTNYNQFRINLGLNIIQYKGFNNLFFVGIVVSFLSSFRWEQFRTSFITIGTKNNIPYNDLIGMTNSFLLLLLAILATDGYVLIDIVERIKPIYLTLYEKYTLQLSECFIDIPTIPCDSFLHFPLMGGQGDTYVMVDMNKRSGVFNVSYNFFATPDNLEIWYGTNRIYATPNGGYINGTGMIQNISYTGYSQLINIRVRAPFDGTTWTVNVSCPI